MRSADDVLIHEILFYNIFRVTFPSTPDKKVLFSFEVMSIALRGSSCLI